MHMKLQFFLLHSLLNTDQMAAYVFLLYSTTAHVSLLALDSESEVCHERIREA
jgi:hypothetical protein